jgi:AcrR family transcriptional regulator
MGRKSTAKARVNDPERLSEWSTQLFPYFREYGIRELNMDRAAGILGVSKATIYRYCKSKEVLILKMLQQKLSSLSRFGGILNGTTGAAEVRYGQSLTFLLSETSDISFIFLKELKETYPDIWELIKAFRAFAQQQLTEFYTKAIAEGEFNEQPVALLVQLDAMFLDKLTEDHSLADMGLSLSEALSSYFELRMDGLLPR